MPVTTVQKMIGAISILISLMKASPSGPILAAVLGAQTPSAMPSAMAISTQIQSWVHHGLAFGLLLRISAGAVAVAVTLSSRHSSGTTEVIVSRKRL